MKQRTAVKAVEDALQHIKMYITAGAWAKTAKGYYVEEPWSHSISKKDLQKFIVLLKLKNSPPPNVARVQIPAWCHMWDEFVAGSLLCSERCFFLRALRFSSLLKNQHFQISIRPGIAVLPPTRYLFIYLFQLFIYSFFLLFFLQSTCEVDSSICDDNEVCIPNYQDNNVRCVCKIGYTGTPCSKLHKKYGYVINCLWLVTA